MTARNSADERFLRRAIQLARRGEGHVEPNPMVGCVLVKRGRLIGEGYHRRFGGPHAEIEALRRCSESPRGATVFVTLEPCCIEGKTPPCTTALVEAGVGRVVAPIVDPNPKVAGRGFATLRKAGITCDVGLLAKPATALIAPFAKVIRRQRPWIILKWAQSLDGKIATNTGDSKWISDEACRAHAHRVRSRLDGIIVGVETAIRDDPMLTCRIGRARRVATRIVLDSRLRIAPGTQLVRTAPEVPTWVFTARDAPARRIKRLEAAGCVVYRVRKTKAGLSLPEVLDVLGRRQMTNVLVEGGGAVLGAFHDARLADEYHIYVAPRLIGGRDAVGPLHGRGIRRVNDLPVLPPDARPRSLGNGWLWQFRASAIGTQAM